MSFHRDPVFDEVAAREAKSQREQAVTDRKQERERQWKASPEYREQMRRRRRRALQRAMRK